MRQKLIEISNKIRNKLEFYHVSFNSYCMLYLSTMFRAGHTFGTWSPKRCWKAIPAGSRYFSLLRIKAHVNRNHVTPRLKPHKFYSTGVTKRLVWKLSQSWKDFLASSNFQILTSQYFGLRGPLGAPILFLTCKNSMWMTPYVILMHLQKRRWDQRTAYGYWF